MKDPARSSGIRQDLGRLDRRRARDSAAATQSTHVSKGRQIRPQIDLIPLDLAGSSTPPLRTARIHRDQAGSSGIWADSIGGAPATVVLCYSEHHVSEGRQIRPQINWIPLDQGGF